MEREAGSVFRASRSPQTQPGTGSRKKPGPGPPEASLARPPLLSHPPSPGGARRGASTKDSNFRAGAGPPRELLAQARPGTGGGSGQGKPGRPGGGADGSGRVPRAAGPGLREVRGEGAGVTQAPGTPRMAEKIVSKYRQWPARRGG